jgi:transposase IS200 family protein
MTTTTDGPSSAFSDAASVYHVRVYTVCLMDTHYHALLDTPRNNLSEFVRALNSEHSKAFNSRHARVGHTFEQRFHSIVVQREKYLRRRRPAVVAVSGVAALGISRQRPAYGPAPLSGAGTLRRWPADPARLRPVGAAAAGIRCSRARNSTAAVVTHSSSWLT